MLFSTEGALSTRRFSTLPIPPYDLQPSVQHLFQTAFFWWKISQEKLAGPFDFLSKKYVIFLPYIQQYREPPLWWIKGVMFTEQGEAGHHSFPPSLVSQLHTSPSGSAAAPIFHKLPLI